MKSNRIIWGLVLLVVLITIAVSFGTRDSHSQQKSINQSQPTPKPNSTGFEDLTKYAVVDYDASLPANAVEREQRTVKNKRYDNQHFVQKNPHPDTGGVGRIDEIPPPPVIPAAESSLIIVGEIVSANAFLSNDKRGIYTEFTIQISEILKNDASNKVNQGNSVTADRAGGFVRYPNGQKVFYEIVQNDLPGLGSKYVLFLTCDKQSPNYQILTGYELKDGGVNPLDTKRSFDDFKGIGKQNFIETVRKKISESSVDKESK